MSKQFKNSIIAIFLVLQFQLPAVLQLVHIFDNEHGIVYLKTNNEIQKTNNADCSVFHQQLHSLFTLQYNFFVVKTPHNYCDTPITYVSVVKQVKTVDFQLRAPPSFA